MTPLPAPLVPRECRLHGLPGMIVDVARLFDSSFYLRSTGDEFKAAFTLWGRAFLQTPAASLPNDEALLAKLSGAGRKWARVRARAMHGWILCSDNRFYHPVVAEKVLAAWNQRKAQQARAKAGWDRDHGGRRGGEPAPKSESTTTYPSPNPQPTSSQPEDNSKLAADKPLENKKTPDAAAFSPAMPIKGREEKVERESDSPTLSSSVATQPSASEKPKRRGRNSEEEPEGFAEWYAVYPRKQGRQDAAKAFPKAIKRAGSLEALIAHTLAFQFPGEPQYIPHPASWLNGKRWEDQPLPDGVERLDSYRTQRGGSAPPLKSPASMLKHLNNALGINEEDDNV